MKIKEHFRENSRLWHFAEIIFYYVFISLFTYVLMLSNSMPFYANHSSFLHNPHNLIRTKKASKNILTSVKMVSILSLISGIILCGITQFASIILFLIFILPTSMTGLLLERIVQPPIKNGCSLPASPNSADSTSAGNIILAKVEYHRPQNAGYNVSPINVVTRSLTLREDVLQAQYAN